MAYKTLYKGVIFVEGAHGTAIEGQGIDTVLSRGLGTQLKSLKDVKDNMCEIAKSQGYNAIICFEYGQKKRAWASDGVAFWGREHWQRFLWMNMSRFV